MPDVITIEEINSQVTTSESNLTIKTAEILNKNTVLVQGNLVEALLSNNEGWQKWALDQNGIGAALNSAFNLNNNTLANCDTAAEIASNDTAINAILSNKEAHNICLLNSTLKNVLASRMTSEYLLGAGLGYLYYNVGDIVQLKMNNTNKNFKVVHKNYVTSNKIVLCSVDTISNQVWATSNKNNYETSNLRQYLNSTVLNQFSSTIQSAIVTTPISCHNFATAVTCNDKIWAPSFTEVGFGTNKFVPVEGEKLDGFSDDNSRKKDTLYWLRTPHNNYLNVAWVVSSSGSRSTGIVADSFGVVAAFEI